ncbi:MAG TPA: hypothetical protein VN700_15970 [Vicinamibacterales bacterium]|nr:hypothetical protein [Vicinamibacterales bacterium]
MTVHTAGVLGLVIIFIIGTLRPVSLGVLALVATFLIGTFMVGEAPRERWARASPRWDRRSWSRSCCAR